MDNGNLFQELHDILVDFRDFLTQNVPTIAPAIQAIATLIPQVVELIDKLIALMDSLRNEIASLDLNAIPELGKATEFINKVKTFLDAARSLLPDEQAAIDEVLEVANVVGSLDGLDAVKQDILDTIDDIKGLLADLKPD